MKKINTALILALAALGSVSAKADVNCSDLSLEGVYNMAENPGVTGPHKLYQFRAVSYSNVYRVAEVRPSGLVPGHYVDVSPGFPIKRGKNDYTIVALSTRHNTCTLSWYSPVRPDFEFSMIVQTNSNGDLGIGGDGAAEKEVYFWLNKVNAN